MSNLLFTIWLKQTHNYVGIFLNRYIWWQIAASFYIFRKKSIESRKVSFLFFFFNPGFLFIIWSHLPITSFSMLQNDDIFINRRTLALARCQLPYCFNFAMLNIHVHRKAILLPFYSKIKLLLSWKEMQTLE